jgi:hypothetical protein
LWALKIHIGCVYRDASLRFDVKDPRSPFILDVSNFAHDVWLFQQMFQNWSNGGTTNPSPFGSVFILDSPHPTPQFDFIHCNMTGVVGIDIGGKFILVFIWDQCDAMYTNIRDQWDRWDAPRVKALGYTGGFNIAHRVWVCESAYWLYRHRRSLSIIKTPTQIVLVPPVWRPEGKPMEEAEYRYVCRNFSLDLVQYNGEVSNVYRPLQDFTAVPRSSAIK